MKIQSTAAPTPIKSEALEETIIVEFSGDATRVEVRDVSLLEVVALSVIVLTVLCVMFKDVIRSLAGKRLP